MPSYLREGSVPHKRHIQFRRPDGGLYAEELFSTKGFESVYSLLYHVRPPTATLDVRPWNRASATFVANEPLRNRHLKSAGLRLGPDPIESRTPLLGNADVVIAVAEAREPMEYFYRNTGGDELFFIHHGAGVIETPFGELAYRERDYLLLPTGTTFRIIPASPTRMLVYETTGAVTIPRRYRNEFGQLEEHAPYYERDFRVPALRPPVADRGEYEIRVRSGDRNAIYVVQNHPCDVIGWDGYC
ncbi:MAG: homogentisate 1,2-dioxygenase, partial [Candidatus Cybelea sp.]